MPLTVDTGIMVILCSLQLFKSLKSQALALFWPS